jgi:1-acyl-sn-glycerol-3-phosphate acyltransferase
MILGIVTGLVPLRFLGVVVSLVGGCSVSIALNKVGLRSLSIYGLRLTCRSILWAAGLLWIPVKGSTSAAFAPGRCPKIIVSNHISWMEILHLICLPFRDSAGRPILPSFVFKETVRNLPFIGKIAADLMGGIGVSRKKYQQQQQQQQSKESPEAVTTSTTMEQILARANKQNNGSCGPLVVFPEGTTTNGTSLLVFKRGAFAPLVKVQPVLYGFGQSSSDPSTSEFLPTYDSIWWPAYLWRLFSQPLSHLECRFLDPIGPEDVMGAAATENKGDGDVDVASAFAEGVRSVMAREANLPMLSSGYDYRHKLQYHDGMRKALVNHPRGAMYAMCFAPMQAVTKTTSSFGFDVVLGTKWVAAEK